MLSFKYKTMKTIKFLSITVLCTLLILVLISGCKKDEKVPVTAFFSVENTEIFTGDTVVFNNSSTNATSFLWNFGDGGTSTEENPTHIYDDEGRYDVRLVSINSDDSDTARRQVEVFQAFDVTIFEGTGIQAATIHDPWSTVQNAFTTDTLYYSEYLSEIEIYYHEVFYPDEGVGFIFYSDTTFILDTYPLFFIFILPPYPGATSKQIAIGSTMEKVLQQYGDPENTIEEEGLLGYWYDSRGVDFYSLNGSGVVNEIDVYDPDDFSKKGAPVHSRTREMLRGRYR
jgi:hypothetical protein